MTAQGIATDIDKTVGAASLTLQEFGLAAVMADTAAAVAYRVDWGKSPIPAAMDGFRLASKAGSAPRRTVDFQEPAAGRQKPGCLDQMAGYRVAPGFGAAAVRR